MAKKKRDKKSNPGKKSDGAKQQDGAKKARKGDKKSNYELVAREAGKAAAKAERIALEALERARESSAYLLDFISHPGNIASSIGSAVSAGQGAVTTLVAGEAGSEESPKSFREAVEARIRATVNGLNVPSRDEHNAITERLAQLETGGARRGRGGAARALTGSATAVASKSPASRPKAAASASTTPKVGTKPVSIAATKTRAKASAKAAPTAPAKATPRAAAKTAPKAAAKAAPKAAAKAAPKAAPKAAAKTAPKGAAKTAAGKRAPGRISSKLA